MSSTQPAADTSSSKLHERVALRRLHLRHEGAIDLEDVDREGAQGRERHVAGTEVIEGDAHAECLQLAQVPGGRGEVVHHRRLGHFEDQPSGVDVRVALERDGRNKSVELGVEEFPRQRADDIAKILLGIEVSRETAVSLRRRVIGLEIANVAPNSSADYTGIQSGDVLLALNRHATENRADFRDAVTSLRGRSSVQAVVARGSYSARVTLELP